MRAAFESAHVNVRQAGAQLGFQSHEARSRLRELVRRGLLCEVEGPRERRVQTDMDGAREIESNWPVCGTGPFFVRDEVLALRCETAHVAGDALYCAPTAVRAAAASRSPEDPIGEFLRMIIDKTR